MSSRNFRYTLLLVFWCIGLLTGCIKTEKADLVVHNAVIYSIDEGFTIHQAMAISDGRILELGPEREIMNKYRYDRIVDARTQPVFPAFFDAHAHFYGAATNMAELNLYGVKSKEEMLDKVIHFAKSNRRTWIVGRGWDQNLWPQKTFPDRSEIDSLFPDTPVYLMRVDGHAALVNSRALEMAGFTPETIISGGELQKNEAGKLTGILVDAASTKIETLIPGIPTDILTENLIKVQEQCFQNGLTTITDAGLTPVQINILDSLQRTGKLKIHIYAMIKADAGADEMIKNGPFNKESLSVRAVKLFADGALGSRGALLKAPYTDDPDNYGNRLLTDSVIERYVDLCFNNGFQLCTHCIGDSANALILRKYAQKLGGITDLRWRIEHAQVVDPVDRHFFSDFAIIPSMQPVAAISDMAWAEDRLGPTRIQYAYDLRSLKQELGFLPLGTDYPVDRLSPIENFHAAVFRKDVDGNPSDGYQLEEALTREDALKGITIWPALASFQEGEKGSLEPGKRADFVIINRDLLKVSEEEVLNAEILATYLGGEAVYSR